MRLNVFVTAVALGLLNVVGFAQSVSYDFDRTADFSRYKRYAWVRGTPVSDPLNDRRIVSAIEGQLAARGMRLVSASENPDMLVAYHAAFDRDLQITGFSSGWGGYRFPGSRSGSARAEEILRGTLIVDMVDAQSKTIVWRGAASKEVDVNAKPEKRDKNITRTAEKLLNNYPPTK
jgi:hypothetical protein